MFGVITRPIGRFLASYLTKAQPGYLRTDTVPIEIVAAIMKPGDILLVEGNTRISTAIKYLSQSSWSHVALYVGPKTDDINVPTLIEADLKNGVIMVPLSKYADFNVRICRPFGITDEEIEKMIGFARAHLGDQYDLKNITDLMRYLIQKPIVPNRMRRQMIGFGSGEPTRAICSTLIAQAYQSIDYPILPRHGPEGHDGEVPAFYKRHFTHFTPRDFDLSPYFEIIKPTAESGFNYRDMKLLEHEALQADLVEPVIKKMAKEKRSA